MQNLNTFSYNYLFIILLFLLLPSHIFCISKYQVYDIQNSSSSIKISAKYTGPQKYYIKQKNLIITDIVFIFQVQTYYDCYFTIRDKNNKRYEIPQQQIFIKDPYKNFTYPISLSMINISYSADYFDFRIYRKINNQTIFSTYEQQFIFSDYYLQVGTEIPTDFTIGLGERFNSDLRLKNGQWTLFNRGRGIFIDHGEGLQSYGYFPFYLQREKAKNYHVVHIRSSNAMDVIKSSVGDSSALTFKIIGGIFDFRFFIGNLQPSIVLSRFQQYIGKSALPPFWSFGFHQSKFGYDNITVYENVIKGYEENNLPLDTLWLDIDYMIDYEDFTIDESRFPLDKLAKISQNYRIVPIIDAGIKINSSSYDEGVKRSVFIKDAKGQWLIGQVWPGYTTFVDFFHPNSTQYWTQMLETISQKVNLSGIWLDMNEYMSFCFGPCQQPQYPSQFDYTKDIPYMPGSDSIQTFTLSLNGTHYGNKKEADVHVYAGFTETYATYQWLKTKFKLPFILSRSTTLGSHKYGFHWTGDNYADFDFLRCSIPDNLLHQMWGIQMVGADICGFGGNTTVQLCSRWFQLGILYPFSRNHNTLYGNPQQPYALGQIVLKAAQNNIKLRYSLLHYFYSLFLENRLSYVWQPLFMQYFNDENNFNDQIMNSQFLIGNNLMAAPILKSNFTDRQVYFSTESWYNLYTGKFYKPGNYIIENISLTDKVPLFLRENSCILLYNNQNIKNTVVLVNKFHLVCGLKISQQNIFISKMRSPSISNFHNESLVNFCVEKFCQYIFNVEYNANVSKMIINVTTKNDINLTEIYIIEEITAYYNQESSYVKLMNPLIIQGNGSFMIQFKSNNGENQKKKFEYLENLKKLQLQLINSKLRSQ